MMDDAVSATDLVDLQASIASWVEESRNHAGPFGTTMDGRARFDVQPGHSAEQPALRRVASPQEVCDVHLRIMRDSPLGLTRRPSGWPQPRGQQRKDQLQATGQQTVVKFHQDFAYEAHSNDDMLAVLLFVDDVTPDNGPLEVSRDPPRSGIRALAERGVHGTVSTRTLPTSEPGLPAMERPVRRA
ncbi:MAG: hypothetical protein Ct9H300mP12_08830 [Acidimicrobiales bacterium]|nr:MAG: hypothetical protein Ct9H300mP12_08830 [Acidimicrobiales bacterium]